MNSLATPNTSPLDPTRATLLPSETPQTLSPFHGRSAAEYVTSFALDLAQLRDSAVLDVGAGPSSFAVECARRGPEVVAVDPLYGYTLDTLATHIQLDYARVGVEATRRLQGKSLAAREALELDRRAAAQRFLADYETGFVHNRYIGGALPRLPFLDRSFDLVLCGNLLFGAHAPFSGAALTEACRELVRVSAKETRIYPYPQNPSAQVISMLKALAADGISAERKTVRNTAGQGRPSTLLILRR